MTPLQETLFTLLCEIDDICREHDICYYLHAGTLLGAVRHEGFIPWDDDADVIMTRDNWEKFLRVMEAHPRKNRDLVCLERYVNHQYPIGRYMSTETVILARSWLAEDYPVGMFVDVIIFDPVKNDQKILKKHIGNVRLLDEIANPSYVRSRETDRRKYFIYRFLESILGRRWVLNHLTEELQHDGAFDGYVQRVGSIPCYWKKEFFMEPERVTIYGKAFSAPTSTLEYLRYTYGDGWVNFPNSTDQTHGYLCFNDCSFNEFNRTFRYKIDVRAYWAACRRNKLKHIRMIPTEDAQVRQNVELRALADAMEVQKRLSKYDLPALYRREEFSRLSELVQFYVDCQLRSDRVRWKVAVDVSDDVFFTTCMVLILRGDYVLAEQLAELNAARQETLPSFSQIEEAIGLTRELSVAYLEGGRNWAEIETLTEKGLRQYPHHAIFIAAKCDLLLQTAEKHAEAVLTICREELAFHPRQPHLLSRMAKALLAAGRLDEAADACREASEHTNDGMLLREIAEVAEQCGIRLAPYRFPKEQYAAEQVTKTQEILRKLLTEIDETCESAGIPYFLLDYLAAEAVALGSFAPGCCSLGILMRPCDREKFICAMNKRMPTGRALESFESNPNYPDFTMRYCDTGTTMFDTRTEGFYLHNAVYIGILFLLPQPQGRARGLLERGLQGAVEACAVPSIWLNRTKKKTVAGFVGRLMFLVLGKKRAKRLAWRQIYHPQQELQCMKGSIKTYWYKEAQFPEVDFGKRTFGSLNGHEFPVPENYETVFKNHILRVKNASVMGTSVGMTLGGFALALDVPCAEFSAALAKKGLKWKHAYLMMKVFRGNLSLKKDNAVRERAWRLTKETHRYVVFQKKERERWRMRLAEKNDETRILDYLSRDVENCLYLYADIWKYGVENPNIRVWFNEDEDGICMVVMKYHNNFQIYSDRKFDHIKEILELAHSERPRAIFGRRELIESLSGSLSSRYDEEYGVVFRGKDFDSETLEKRLEDCTAPIELASEADAPAIARLLCTDKNTGTGQTVESLTKELVDRIRTGMGRSYIIRAGTEIAAHCATYAETERFVVISGLNVQADYRDTEYTLWIDGRTALNLIREGKERYFFAVGPKMIRYYRYTGAHPVGEYGKLYLKE